MVESTLILASTSPRRHALLQEAGFPFTIVPAEIEESTDPSLLPLELTKENAQYKALHVAKNYPNHLVLGADTLVSLRNTPLGKPKDRAAALATLALLNGQTHQVYTSVCIIHQSKKIFKAFTEVTEVTFKKFTTTEIETYLSRINPYDKAGAYAAQEQGELIIDHIDGSFTNVVGLPMEKVTPLLKDLLE